MIHPARQREINSLYGLNYVLNDSGHGQLEITGTNISPMLLQFYHCEGAEGGPSVERSQGRDFSGLENQ